jgi:glycosyltransferase involved in cell wall biosynthesis
MDIAHLLPRTAHFPVAQFSGRYDWALRLALRQAADGHKVTIYAAPGSGEGLSQVAWKSSSFDFEHKTLNNIALVKTALSDGRHDIYHSHFDKMHYFLGDDTEKPIVYTQHWFPNAGIASAARFNAKRNVIAVPPTHYMHAENKQLGMVSAEVIPHGIDLDVFRPINLPLNERLIFVGRISPQKGVLEAVQLARAANQKLDIVGRIKDKDMPYWKEIEALVDGEQIRYLGAKTQPEIAALFSQAKAFIFPAQVQEAFGQVTVEAQACGTPVIINDIGASNELVADGKTGFVVKTEAEFIQSINNIGRIDRKDCREFAEQFDMGRMVGSYNRLYAELVG